MFRYWWPFQSASRRGIRRQRGRAGRKPHGAARLRVESLDPRILLSFSAPANYATGGPAAALAVADLNGDGITDLVTGNGGGTASVLLGNGDGSFQPPWNLVAGEGLVYAVAVGDFNGDGIPDLVATATGLNTGDPGTLTLVLGNGDGTFQAGTTFGQNEGRLAVGDFNGDGNLDLVTSTGNLFLGNGDGTFQAPSGIGATGTLAVGDFNNDGNLDVVLATFIFNSQLSVLLGNGDGSFQAPRTYAVGPNADSVAIGDLNGDGVPDLVVANGAPVTGTPSVSVLLGNGDGSFQAARNYDAGPDPDAVALGDLNGDGVRDVVVINAGYATLSFMLGNGDGSLQAPQRYDIGSQATSLSASSSVAVVDLNGDGAPDLAVVNAYGGAAVSVRLNNGDGTFPDLPKYDTGLAATVAQAMITADFNGDGIPDVAAGYNGLVSVLFGNGDGSFQAPITSRFGGVGAVTSLAAGDFDGDGQLDLVVYSAGAPRHGSSSVAVLLGGGDGMFHTSFMRNTANGFSTRDSVAVGDFNGDGHPDLVVSNLDSMGSIGVLLGNGDGSFQAPVDYAAGGPYVALAVADLNQDGRPDIVVASVLNFAQLTVSILPGNGDGSFQNPQTVLSQVTNYLYPSLAIADFNGDGAPDLVVNAHDVWVLLGNGDGTFQPAIDAAPGSFVTSLGVADFNGDGIPDLAVSSAGGNGPTGVGVLLGNGDGTFQPTSISYGSAASVGAVADFNGDGFPDVATPNITSPTISVLLNAADWPGTPQPPRGAGNSARRRRGFDSAGSWGLVDPATRAAPVVTNHAGTPVTVSAHGTIHAPLTVRETERYFAAPAEGHHAAFSPPQGSDPLEAAPWPSLLPPDLAAI